MPLQEIHRIAVPWRACDAKVVTAGALGASALISCCAVAIYMHYQRQKHAWLNPVRPLLLAAERQCRSGRLQLRYAVAVGTEDQEVVQRSEGGYRMKKSLVRDACDNSWLFQWWLLYFDVLVCQIPTAS